MPEARGELGANANGTDGIIYLYHFSRASPNHALGSSRCSSPHARSTRGVGEQTLPVLMALYICIFFACFAQPHPRLVTVLLTSCPKHARSWRANVTGIKGIIYLYLFSRASPNRAIGSSRCSSPHARSTRGVGEQTLPVLMALYICIFFACFAQPRPRLVTVFLASCPKHARSWEQTLPVLRALYICIFFRVLRPTAPSARHGVPRLMPEARGELGANITSADGIIYLYLFSRTAPNHTRCSVATRPRICPLYAKKDTFET